MKLDFLRRYKHYKLLKISKINIQIYHLSTTSILLQNKRCLLAVRKSFWRSSLEKELMPVKLNLMKFMRWKDRYIQN